MSIDQPRVQHRIGDRKRVLGNCNLLNLPISNSEKPVADWDATLHPTCEATRSSQDAKSNPPNASQAHRLHRCRSAATYDSTGPHCNSAERCHFWNPTQRIKQDSPTRTQVFHGQINQTNYGIFVQYVQPALLQKLYENSTLRMPSIVSFVYQWKYGLSLIWFCGRWTFARGLRGLCWVFAQNWAQAVPWQ